MVTVYGGSVCENDRERVDVWFLWNEWGNTDGKKYFGRVMSIYDGYFGTVYQINTPSGVPPITNFRLPDGTKPTNVFFTGIPLVVNFVSNLHGKIGLYKTDPNDEIKYFVESTTLTTAGIQIYTNFLPNTDRKYFSTINDGNVVSPAQDNPFPFPDIPAVLATVPDSNRYYTYRYFTQLNANNVNLNTSTDVTLGWSSSDISGNYGDDIATVRIFKYDIMVPSFKTITPGLAPVVTFTKQGTLIAGPFDITNNTIIPTALFSTIPSDTYFITYDFMRSRRAKMAEYGYQILYYFGNEES